MSTIKSLNLNTDSTIELDKIASNLSRIMETNRVKTKVLSDATGISIAAINNLKRGEGNPTIGTLSTIASFFDIPLATFLGLSNESFNKSIIISLVELRDSHKKAYTEKEKLLIEQPQNIDPSSLFGVVITDSFYFYPSGTIFITSKNRELVDGDLIVARIDNSFNTIKRCFIREDGFNLQDIVPNSDGTFFSRKNIDIIGNIIQINQKLS